MDNWVLSIPYAAWPLRESGIESKERADRVLFRFFETKRTVVVLSSSNAASRETIETACAQENVPILKRRGGGGTVVLGPGCLVLTFAFLAKDLFGNGRYFSIINKLWADALADVGIKNIEQSGISDLAVAGRKIAGTSIFRKKHLLVYQGSLLVDPDFPQIARLLAHPSREPDYRKGREHLDFLTSTSALGCALNAEDLATHCREYFAKHVTAAFQSEFVSHKVLKDGGLSFWSGNVPGEKTPE